MRIKPQRLQKRHNLKGRIQKYETLRDNDSAAAHVRVDPSVFGGSGYDSSLGTSSNQLILPATKVSTKRKLPTAPSQKRLSKKQRKALEKIVDQKKKKEQRSTVLEDLQKYRLDTGQLDKLVPVVSLSRGADPRKSQYEVGEIDKLSSRKNVRIRPLSGCRRKGALCAEDTAIERMNIVVSSSSDSETADDVEADQQSGCHLNKVDTITTTECPVKNEPIEQLTATTETAVIQPIIDIVNESKVNVSSVSSRSDETRLDNVTTEAPTQALKKQLLKFTPVYREKDVQDSRLKLPILSEEHAIMEAISDNPVVIVCGETGSGKTTQVPQFLYEAGYSEYGTIGVTEPRRVAAVAMSRRVAEEMSLTDSGKVSFVIRYEGTASEETKIKFMTDGVLLKEVENDFLLTAYSVIVIDEAHERSVFTDILIGLLSRIVRLRAKRGNPLKLVIMSATLRIDDFIGNKHLFGETPPVIKIESRQFPVSVHFSRQTPSDYMEEAYRKVCKLHGEQPAGGILVFVTGQDEVHWLVSKLRTRFSKSHNNSNQSPSDEPKKRTVQHANRYPSKRLISDQKAVVAEKSIFDALNVNLDEYSLRSEVDAVDHDEEDGNNEDIKPSGMISKDNENDSDDTGANTEGEETQPMWVLPLYALLSTNKQQLVFQPPPDPTTRLCVVSTNVGETSLTIPNIRYVIDTGKVKTKLYDKVTGVSTFVVTWASKASAIQRAGRAGRMGPGHCYRLYSTAVFTDEMPQFAEPEIARRPVDDLVLQMKAIGIDRVMNFPFPTPPPSEAVAAAETLLIKLGALAVDETKKPSDTLARITDLGRLMARLPVSPRFARVLCAAPDRKSLTYLIAMLSGLSVQELLLTECETGNDSEKANETDEAEEKPRSNERMRQIRAAWCPPGEGRLLGDAGLFLRAIGAAEYSNASPEFCRACGVRAKALLEARKVRRQLTSVVNSLHPSLNIVIDPKMSPPDDGESKVLRRLLLTGFGDRVAKRIEDTLDERTTDENGKRQSKRTKPGGSYAANGLDGTLTIHPSSVLYRERPTFIMFQEVSETSVSTNRGTVYLKLVTAIEPLWLPSICSTYCTFGEVAEDQVAGESVTPRWDAVAGTVKCHRKAAYGTHNWNLGLVEVDYPPGVDRIRWFARLLLEGKVITVLEQYVPVLLGAPLTVVKSWGRLQPRTEILVRTLYGRNVDNMDSLIAAWQEDSKFLLGAYLEWLPSSLHAQVSVAWPPIVVMPSKKDV